MPDSSTQALDAVTFPGFVVRDRIGRGGMGAVYEVEKDGITYALKTIPQSQASVEALARFEREALAAAAVGQHPNIVSIHQLVLDTKPPFIVMDFVDGRSLEHWIQPREPWSSERILKLMEPLVCALDYIHNQGVIHRDLKPPNILIRDRDGAPLITDFGIARDQSLDTLTQTGQFLGTPHYMAPEQFTGEDTRPETDVWALGVIVFELLTAGKRPFVGRSTLELAQKIMFAEPLSLRSANRRCSEDLETVLLKALSKNPAQRYETCSEFLEDLRRAAQGQAISATRESLLRRNVRRLRQRYGRVSALVSLALIVALGLGLWFSSTPRSVDSYELYQSAQFLKSVDDKDHFHSHVFEALGGPPVNEASCLEIQKNAQKLSRFSTLQKQRQLALRFFACDKDAAQKLGLTKELPSDEALIFRAYMLYKTGAFQKSLELIQSLSPQAQARLQTRPFLLALLCQLKRYDQALEYYDPDKDKELPRAIQEKLQIYQLTKLFFQKGSFNDEQTRLFQGLLTSRGEAFEESWNQVVLERFRVLSQQNRPRALLSYYERDETLRHLFNLSPAITLSVPELKQILQLDRSSRLQHRFLALHYQVQKQDPNYRLPEKYQAYCKDGRISVESIQAATRGQIVQKQTASREQLELLLFCSRAKLFVENFLDNYFSRLFTQSAIIDRALENRASSPHLGLWKLLYRSPELFRNKGPQENKSKQLFERVLQSKHIAGVYKAILYQKRGLARYEQARQSHDLRLNSQCRDDLRKALAFPLPNSHRMARVFRDVETAGLDGETLRERRRGILDQLDQWSSAVEERIKTGEGSMKLGDARCYLEPITERAGVAVLGLVNIEKAQFYYQIGEYQSSLSLTLTIAKSYPNLEVLTLLKDCIVKTKRRVLVEDVAKLIKRVAATKTGSRRDLYLKLLQELKRAF